MPVQAQAQAQAQPNTGYTSTHDQGEAPRVETSRLEEERGRQRAEIAHLKRRVDEPILLRDQLSGTANGASTSSRAHADSPPPREFTPPSSEEDTSRQASPHTEPSSESPPPEQKAANTSQMPPSTASGITATINDGEDEHLASPSQSPQQGEREGQQQGRPPYPGRYRHCPRPKRPNTLPADPPQEKTKRLRAYRCNITLSERR